MARKTNKSAKSVETLTHEEATRTNIPTAEYQSVMKQEEQEWRKDGRWQRVLEALRFEAASKVEAEVSL